MLEDSALGYVSQGAWTGDHVAQGHMAETYIAWMAALDGMDDFASTHTGLMVACPVDVRVYSPDGELVAEIVDGQVNEGLLEGGLAAWVDGEAKYVDLPDEDAYRVELTPTDDGEMDVVLTHRDEADETIEQVGYDGLSLEEGESYQLTTTGDATEETSIVDESSLVAPGAVEVEPDYVVEGDGLGAVSLTATAEGAGIAVCPASATRGDYVTARAIAGEGSSFEGWYEGGELVSDEPDYQFCARADRSLVARFAAAPAIDIEGATVTVSGATYTGGELMPKVTVTLGGVELTGGTDYEVSYADNVEVGTATVTVTGKGNYTGTATATFMIVELVAFVDVTASTAHADDIAWLAEQGISKGWDMADGTKEFRPYANVARADMAAFLFRLAKGWGLVDESWQPSGSASFLDVTSSTAHYREILWLAESGISRGWDVSGGKEFRPYANVARADMAAFLCRLQAIRQESTPSASGASPFLDVTSGTAHYEDILWLAKSGISQGWTVAGGKEFRPYANVARADMAAFLHRMDALG